MATRFDYWHVAGHCKKEDRSESGSLSELSLGTGKCALRVFQFYNAKDELGQLTKERHARMVVGLGDCPRQETDSRE